MVSPREPVKLVDVFTGHTAREPVVMFPVVNDHEVSVGDVSSDAGDGMADCAHLGLVPLDVHLHAFWRTTLLFSVDLIVFASRGRFHGDFRLFATWRSDSALSSETSKTCSPVVFHPS